MYHYCYRITNTTLCKHYYGSRTSMVTPREDLGVHYFSSSRYVKRDIATMGQTHFRFKVIRHFANRIEAYHFEERLQRKLSVATRDDFYNRCVQTHKFSWTGGKHSVETKRVMSETRKGRIPWNKGQSVFDHLTSEERSAKFGSSGSTNPFYGKSHSDESRQRISERHKMLAAAEGYQNPFDGKQHTKEVKAILQQKALTQFSTIGHPRVGTTHRKVTCADCNKTIAYPMWKRWHDGKCKN